MDSNLKCIDIDECNSNLHDCPANSLCTNIGKLELLNLAQLELEMPLGTVPVNLVFLLMKTNVMI